MFKNITFIHHIASDNADPFDRGVETYAWRLKYKGKLYGNVITNAIFGETYTSPDGYIGNAIIGVKDLTNKDLIELFENMVTTMKLLEQE